MKPPFPLTFSLLLLLGCGDAPSLKAVRARRGDVRATVSNVNSGTVRAEHEAELSFAAVGRVREVNARAGDIVQEGQLLATLENRELVTALRNAERELHRANALLRAKVLSPAEVEPRQNSYDAALASYERSFIRAPFRGLLVERNLEPGQLSQVTTPESRALLRLVDLEPRYVVTEVDEVDLPHVQVGTPATVKVLAIRREPFLGTVRKIVRYVRTTREQDRTSPIEVSIDTPDLLPVGASADVELIVQERRGVVSLPSKVVLGRHDHRYVYRLDGGRAKRTEVKTGIFNYEATEITEGLLEGAIVLYPSEAFDITDGAEVRLDGSPD
jgi:HlyD family secretion protein